MDYTQVIEPAFHIVGISQRTPPGEGMRRTSRQKHTITALFFFKTLAAGRGMEILERMGFCTRPRILSARCLAEPPEKGTA